MSGLDKIVAQNVEYDNTTSGMTADDVQEAIDEISAASITINAKVQYFANLPAASSHSGETYYVEEYSTSAGTDYLSGLYLSNGTSWTFRDDKIVYSLTAFTGTNKILKTNDTNKEVVETLVEIDSNNNIDLKSGGLKDTDVATAVKLGSATDTSLNTTKKDILGGINENKSNIDLKANDNAVVHLTGDEIVAGIKTLSSSPIVPTPTTDMQAATKKYVDDMSYVENVKLYGAVGDGVTNDTTAINAALTAAGTSKKNVYFPAGTYLYNGGGVAGNGVIARGDGKGASIIRSALAVPTDDCILTCSGTESGVKGIYFDALGTVQTGGRFVCLSGPDSWCEECYFTNDKIGLVLTGSGARARHLRFQDAATGGIRILATGGDTSQVIEDVLMGAQTPANTALAGIMVINSSALILSNVSVIGMGYGLLLNPADNTESVFNLFANNCFFDQNVQNISIQPATTGGVYRCRFANCWTGSATTSDGIYLTGTCKGIHFIDCQSVNNTAGSGISIAGTACEDIHIYGGQYSDNVYGVYVDTIKNLVITNASIGAGADFGGNDNDGIRITDTGTTSDYIVITNNVLIGNGSAAITDSSVGANKTVTGNV